MSLEALKQEILKSAEARRKEILEEAKSEAEKILAEAKARAERIIKKKRESIIKDLGEKKKAAYAVARLEGKKKVMCKRDELVRKAFEEARKRLIEIKDTDKYLEILAKYIIESLKELNIDRARLRVSRDDYELVNNNLKLLEKKVGEELNKKISLKLLKEYVNILGGVVVSDEEDKIFYTNTFDSRLKLVYDEERDDVLKILFGD
jgi:V/A-type H+-transporting ATPase subunit E